MAVTVREMRQGERKDAAAALATAFRYDPVNRFIGSRPERDRILWDTLLRFQHGDAASVDLAVDGRRVVGVGVWDPPGHAPSLMSRLRAGPGFLRALGRDARKGAQVEEWMARHRPQEPFWYLAHLGATEPGKGVGSALLNYRLAQLDREGGRTAYLENSNERNLRLYERFGFEVTSRLDGGPEGAPPVWGMVRRPA
ncbi:acetyltransferase (GNAT) family protein [Knoellia remsis]|uniref:Acetyltransferase (GNAT) family protein n=1 Tax=Knoellia remsis TaxID=407159 RepID=A0A2T0U8D7_9MICO|nr:GNAT family N-acetyltransferase [Knoellia remsis]PRY54118.1 acetyltransferase (GNAT) family protein [Knoellia remsis]